MDTGLIFKYNNLPRKKYFIKKGIIEYGSMSEKFNAYTIESIIEFVNSIIDKYKKIDLATIVFNFHENVEFQDKLTYVMFECICYYLIKNYNANIVLGMIPKNLITSDGVNASPLLILNKEKNAFKRKKEFLEKFLFSTSLKKYRRVVNNDSNSLNTLITDIFGFLKRGTNIEESICMDVAKILSELVGNSNEHANVPCLIDIDLSYDYQSRNKNDSKTYYALNIVILDFSEIKFGDNLQKKMKTSNSFSNRYGELQSYYNKHKKYFDDVYTEEDFFNISCMQYEISGREKLVLSGGRGLTQFINLLTQYSSGVMCYMISGSRLLKLENDYLVTNKLGWIGFNSENDLNMRPNIELFEESTVFVPGTAFNFTFVFEKKE